MIRSCYKLVLFLFVLGAFELLLEMFAVQELQHFLSGARPFRDVTQVDDALRDRGLQVDTTTCASYPEMSRVMEMPHYFSHKYAGLQMLFWGQEEWQMCKIVKDFVSENTVELKEDTSQYFSTVSGPMHSVVRFATQMCKRFMSATPALIYLLARACNAHTRVHFKNCTWSTVSEKVLYYVAVEFAAVHDRFVMLSSLDQESVEVMIGQIAVCSHDFVYDDMDMDVNNNAFESVQQEVESVCSEVSSVFDVPHPQMDDTNVKECSVSLTRLSHVQCFPQSGHKVRIMVERMSHSLLSPGTVFRSEKPSKSSLFPDRKFHSAYDWHGCTVPQEKPSITGKKPGFLFSSMHGPTERPSCSQAFPQCVFRAVSAAKGPVPADLNPSVTCKRVAVMRPCVSQSVKTMFTCKVCKEFKCVETTRAAIKHHVEEHHAMYTCRNAHCVVGFKSKSGRDIHEAVHMPKKRQCKHCSSVFTHRFQLEWHMVLHQKRPSQKCDKCHKKYFCKQDLKEHMQTTHGGSKFSCSQCAYTGNSARGLKQHELVHKGPTMRCLQCNRSFRWHSQVAAHKCK